MISLLRFVGVVNAAIWFGAAVFFTLGVGPAFFSPKMLNLLGRPHAGAAVQVVLERYFLLHQVCGIVALAHLLTEWLYMSKPLERGLLALLVGVFVLGLLGGFAIQPHLQQLHLTIYAPGFTPEEREQARQSFRVWHGTSQVLNLVITFGVVAYLWRITSPANFARFRT